MLRGECFNVLGGRFLRACCYQILEESFQCSCFVFLLTQFGLGLIRGQELRLIVFLFFFSIKYAVFFCWFYV
jgi:hypothetical protein